MTPRQRVLAALNHQQPDRVPIDFGAHRSSGIAAIAYRKLRKALGLPERTIRVYDPVQQLAIIDEDVLERFRVDTIELGRGFALEDKDWADWVLPDGSPCQMPAWALPEREPGEWVIRSKQQRPRAGEDARRGVVLRAVLLAVPGGRRLRSAAGGLGREHVVCGAVAARAAGFRAGWAAAAWPKGPRPCGRGPIGPSSASSAAICWRSGSSSIATTTSSCSWPPTPIGPTSFSIGSSRSIWRTWKSILAAVGPYIDIIVFGDDLGMQNGPQMSRAMYRELFMPRHARLWKRAKELADVKVMLHSCGGIRPLLPDLIEAGLDAVNPVQITCAGMDAAALKADFGDKITFWGGGCDTRFVLSKAAPDDIQQHVRRQVEILNRGGGFVFQLRGSCLPRPRHKSFSSTFAARSRS